MILKEENQKIADDARKCCLIKHPGLPVRITIETTSKCNLRCRICQIKRPTTGDKEKSRDQLIKIIKGFRESSERFILINDLAYPNRKYFWEKYIS